MLDALWFGLIVMLIGLLVVFVGLALLIACIRLMSRLAAALDAHKAQHAG